MTANRKSRPRPVIRGRPLRRDKLQQGRSGKERQPARPDPNTPMPYSSVVQHRKLGHVVGVIPVDGLAAIAARGDVVDGAREFDAQGAGNGPGCYRRDLTPAPPRTRAWSSDATRRTQAMIEADPNHRALTSRRCCLGHCRSRRDRSLLNSSKRTVLRLDPVTPGPRHLCRLPERSIDLRVQWCCCASISLREVQYNRQVGCVVDRC